MNSQLKIHHIRQRIAEMNLTKFVTDSPEQLKLRQRIYEMRNESVSPNILKKFDTKSSEQIELEMRMYAKWND